jgi:hypothetical protein
VRRRWRTARAAVLDGEAVVADARGFPDFGLLHADLVAGRKNRLLYYAFDLLYLDGVDTCAGPLVEREDNYAPSPRWRRPVAGEPCFGKSETFRLSASR